MNIQSKSPRSSINWKQISIIAIVLGVSAFQYINSRKDAANQNTAQSGGTAQLDSPEDIDLDVRTFLTLVQGNARFSDLPFKALYCRLTDRREQ